MSNSLRFSRLRFHALLFFQLFLSLGLAPFYSISLSPFLPLTLPHAYPSSLLPFSNLPLALLLFHPSSFSFVHTPMFSLILRAFLSVSLSFILNVSLGAQHSSEWKHCHINETYLSHMLGIVPYYECTAWKYVHKSCRLYCCILGIHTIHSHQTTKGCKMWTNREIRLKGLSE